MKYKEASKHFLKASQTNKYVIPSDTAQQELLGKDGVWPRTIVRISRYSRKPISKNVHLSVNQKPENGCPLTACVVLANAGIMLHHSF